MKAPAPADETWEGLRTGVAGAGSQVADGIEMGLRRSQLNRLTEPRTFLWLTGIEDTFITAPWPSTGRTLDEYALTGHYQQWRADLDLMAELGVRTVRYGVPWHRINPARNQWDWSFADATLERLLELAIEPIVDLIHYGLPAWMEKAYLCPDYPERAGEYAARVAERYKGKIHCYTPLNEPRVTAWYCGKLGWWPPQRKGWSGFVAVMLAVCRGIIRTVESLREVDEEIVPVHVDATDLYESADPTLAEEVARRQELVFLALDLIAGLVDREHPLRSWLGRFGATEMDLAWFQEHALELPLVGINLYPLFSRKVLVRSQRGLRIRMPYAGAEIVEKLGRMYWQRYRCPVFIAETASEGTVARRRAWLEASVGAVRTLRAEGVPVVGYTWWPMFALVTWAYRQGRHPPEYYLKQMGLWDLRPETASMGQLQAPSPKLPKRSEGQGTVLARVRTPLVEAYQDLVRGEAASVGELQSYTREAAHYV